MIHLIILDLEQYHHLFLQHICLILLACCYERERESARALYMDDCVSVVDDREKLVSLSEEMTTEEEVKPRSAAADDNEVEEKLKQNGGGGGLINQLMSNLPSAALYHKEEEEEEVVVVGEVVKVEMIVEQKQQQEEEENGGTGILNKILSHFHHEQTPADHEVEAAAGESNDGAGSEPISSDHEQKLQEYFSGESAAGGGIIDKIISHFHEPAAPALQKVESRKEEAAAAGESVDGGEQSINGGGGIIDKIISHLHGFEETAAAADQEEFVHSHAEQAQLQEVGSSNHKEQVAESNGGGILNQIITNLPTVSIPDHDMSPKAEEASLLIHIVQD